MPGQGLDRRGRGATPEEPRDEGMAEIVSPTSAGDACLPRALTGT